MELPTEFLTQAIVLAGILAGFAFSVTAQVALGNDPEVDVQKAAMYFLTAGICSIVTVLAGLAYLLPISVPLRGFLTALLLLNLAWSVSFFIVGLFNLLQVKLRAGSIVIGTILSATAIPLIIAIIVFAIRSLL